MAWDLLSKFQFKGTEQVLDVGCGDGKITAAISRLLQRGSLQGIDISKEMIDFAKIKFRKDQYPNLTFTHTDALDFSNFSHRQNFDLIFSNGVLHLVSDPLTMRSNLKRCMKKDGKLLLGVPLGKNKALVKAGEDLFKKYQLPIPWKIPIGGASLSERSHKGYSKLLKKAGFSILSIEEEEVNTPYVGKEELVDWMIGTATANWGVPVNLCETFFREVVDKMKEYDDLVSDANHVYYFRQSVLKIECKQSFGKNREVEREES